MFPKFDSHFARDPFSAEAFDPSPETWAKIYPPLRGFFARYSGQSFSKGLYRVIGPATLDSAADFVSVAFPEFRDRTRCFAYDWMARIFALDTTKSRGGKPQMIMFEPDNALAFELPRTLYEFHEIELPARGKEILNSDRHGEWLRKGEPVPKPDEAVCFNVPLFLSGKDTVNDMTMYPLDVQWHILDQVIERTRHLPPGTRVTGWSIGD